MAQRENSAPDPLQTTFAQALAIGPFAQPQGRAARFSVRFGLFVGVVGKPPLPALINSQILTKVICLVSLLAEAVLVQSK